MVIFTSDHGEMLGAHGMRDKFVFYEESSHIPLLMRFPVEIKSNKAVDGYVSLVDLFPTLVRSSGLALDVRTEGIDRSGSPGARQPIFSEHLEPGGYEQALRRERVKVVRRIEPGESSAKAPPVLLCGAPRLVPRATRGKDIVWACTVIAREWDLR